MCCLDFKENLAPGAFWLCSTAMRRSIRRGRERRRASLLDFLEKIEGERPKSWVNAGQRLRQPILDHPAFECAGTVISAPVRVAQNITHFLRCEHSRATWSEEYLGEKASAQFDEGLTELLAPFATDGVLTFSVQTRVEWGRIP